MLVLDSRLYSNELTSGSVRLLVSPLHHLASPSVAAAAAAAYISSPSVPYFPPRKLDTTHSILHFDFPGSTPPPIHVDASSSTPAPHGHTGTGTGTGTVQPLALGYPVVSKDSHSGKETCTAILYRFAIATDDQNEHQPNWCIELKGIHPKFQSCTSISTASTLNKSKTQPLSLHTIGPRTTIFLSELPDLVPCYPALSRLYRASASSLPSTWCSRCGFAEYPSHFCDKPGCSITLCRLCRQRFLPMSDKQHEVDSKSPRYHYFSHNQHQHSALHSSLRSSFNAIPTALIVCYSISQQDLRDFFDTGLTSAGMAQWGMGLYVFSIWVESTTDTEAKIKELLPIMDKLHISQTIVVWFSHHDPLQRLLVYESANMGPTDSDNWSSVGKVLAPIFRVLHSRVQDGQQYDQTSAHRCPLDDIGLIVMTCEAHPDDAQAMLQQINSNDTILVRDIVSFRSPLNIEKGQSLLSDALLCYTNRSLKLTHFNDAHHRRHPTWIEALQISMATSFIILSQPFIVSASTSQTSDGIPGPATSPPLVTYRSRMLDLLDLGKFNSQRILPTGDCHTSTSTVPGSDRVPGLKLTPTDWQAEVNKENLLSPHKRRFHSVLQCGEHHLTLAQQHRSRAASHIIKALQPVLDKHNLYPPPRINQPATSDSAPNQNCKKARHA